MANSSNKSLGWELPGFTKDKDKPAEKFYLAKHSPEDETISLGEFAELAVLESGDNIALAFGFPSDRTDLPLKMDCAVSRFLVFLIHSKPFKFYKDEVQPSKGELALHAYFKGLVGNFYANGKIRYGTDVNMWDSPTEPWGIVLGSKVEESVLGEEFRAIVSDIKSKAGQSSGGKGGNFTPPKSYREKYQEKLAVVAPLAFKIAYPNTDMPKDADLEIVAMECLQDFNPKQLAAINFLMP